MRTPRSKLIIASSLLLVAAAVAWTLLLGAKLKPPVSLTVVSYSTNQWSDELATLLGESTYVRAVIAVTNNSREKFTYAARGSAHSAEYEVLRETPQGWKAPGGFRCGMGITEHTLLPGQGFTFEATVDFDTPCKVEFSYFDGRRLNQIWYRLPSWLTQRLPWLSPRRAVTTDPIDLRGPRT